MAREGRTAEATIARSLRDMATNRSEGNSMRDAVQVGRRWDDARPERVPARTRETRRDGPGAPTRGMTNSAPSLPGRRYSPRSGVSGTGRPMMRAASSAASRISVKSARRGSSAAVSDSTSSMNPRMTAR